MRKYIIAIIIAIINSSFVNAAYVNSGAYFRDYDYNIIGYVEEGEYVESYGSDTTYPDRTIICYNGNMGTILTECISDYKESNNESEYHDYSIEVSIDDQYIYLLDIGAVVKSSPCVTGNCGTKDTPRGTYSIFNKSEGTYLSGADYNCYVDYWMAFNGGIGIHDASWRGDFGGDIYMGNGSHGCINVPHRFAETLYSLCDVGTIVSVY